jgi:hypothetical protein
MIRVRLDRQAVRDLREACEKAERSFGDRPRSDEYLALDISSGPSLDASLDVGFVSRGIIADERQIVRRF